MGGGGGGGPKGGELSVECEVRTLPQAACMVSVCHARWLPDREEPTTRKMRTEKRLRLCLRGRRFHQVEWNWFLCRVRLRLLSEVYGSTLRIRTLCQRVQWMKNRQYCGRTSESSGPVQDRWLEVFPTRSLGVWIWAVSYAVLVRSVLYVSQSVQNSKRQKLKVTMRLWRRRKHFHEMIVNKLRKCRVVPVCHEGISWGEQKYDSTDS